MKGAILVELIAKVGWPMAKEIIKLWTVPEVTPEHIKRLDEIAEKEGSSYFTQ